MAYILFRIIAIKKESIPCNIISRTRNRSPQFRRQIGTSRNQSEIRRNKITIHNQYPTNNLTNKNIQDSDNDLAEKITQIPNKIDKNPNFKGNPSFKKGVDTDIELPNADKNYKINGFDHQNIKTENIF